MIEDERHVESSPYREPLQSASHDHQDDEGQRIPGIDRAWRSGRRNRKASSRSPAPVPATSVRRPVTAQQAASSQGDRHPPLLGQPAEQREPAGSVVALLPPVAGQETDHQDTDRHQMRHVRRRSPEPTAVTVVRQRPRRMKTGISSSGTSLRPAARPRKTPASQCRFRTAAQPRPNTHNAEMASRWAPFAASSATAGQAP